MIDESFGDIGVKVLALDEPQKEFVDYLYVGPSDFQDRLVLFRIKCIANRIDRGWYRPKEILTEHVHDPRVHWLRNDLPIVGHVV